MDDRTLGVIMIGIVYPILVLVSMIIAVFLSAIILGKDKPPRRVEHRVRK